MAEITIYDGNFQQFLSPVHDGEIKVCGTIPRDYGVHPVGFLGPRSAFDIPLIPESEWQTRLDEMKARKGRLSDIREKGGPSGGRIPARDQNAKGYCWAHSGVSAHLLTRAAFGEPYADLSAFSVACMVKGFRDEGGWGSEGIEFEASKGCATSATWPQQSMSRSNDNPNTWAEAAKYKYVEWVELPKANMKAAMISCLLQGYALIGDFNWWSHSVCIMDLEALSLLTIRILNSWGDSWSENGAGLLQGSKAMPDDAWACRLITVAA